MNNSSNQFDTPQDAQLFLAPAKVNLMLKIIGRKANGYHQLETIFCLIDLCDEIYLRPRNDEQIILNTPIQNVLSQDNLCFKAAQKLFPYRNKKLGIDIWTKKIIPIGGGLGGGSSDAATILMALNILWECRLGQKKLQEIGLSLGADVPFFIFGRPAFATGIGENLEEINIKKQWFVIIKPNDHVSTAKIFNHPDLTRDSSPSIIRSLESHFIYQNDMQEVVFNEYPEVFVAYQVLKSHNEKSMMSGSGACVFSVFDNLKDATHTYKKVKEKFTMVFLSESLDQHPLCCFSKVDGESSSG